jgi:predicted metal-dependent enzyme (double-stranded beta helix superfamily)
MFDVDSFVAACKDAVSETDPQRAVRELLAETLEHPQRVAGALAADVAGLNIVYNSADLTVLNVIWAPKMKLLPHDHRMWAVIGIYGGAEDNAFYRRGAERIQAAGGRTLSDGDVLALGADAIHSVTNPERRFTGAIHVYGGDFINKPRSQWDPDTLIEQPYDFEYFRSLFAAANEEWRRQAGTDVDETVG